MPPVQNLFADLPTHLPEELFETLAGSEDVRIERIVSRGHASPERFWYDQLQHEFVLLLRGTARLRFEDEDAIIELKPGLAGRALHLRGGRRMGLFDWLKGTPGNVTEEGDVIWLTRQAKLNGIRRAVSRSLSEKTRPDAIILLAHFQDCLDELQKIVEADFAAQPVTAATVGTLQVSRPVLGESHTIEIVAGERHPLDSHDAAVVEFARQLPCRCRLVHHVSLEDPLMRAFAGEWVETMLKKLGMSEDEAIESAMVARRIKAAQQKLGSQCTSDYPADSAEKWMERNCPEMWRAGPT